MEILTSAILCQLDSCHMIKTSRMATDIPWGEIVKNDRSVLINFEYKGNLSNILFWC